MGFVKVGDVLPKIADLSEESGAMEAAYVVEMVNGKIEEIFGEKAVGSVRAVRYKKGVLTLGVVSSVWGHEVKMQERLLVYKLKDIFLDNNILFKIIYCVI